MDHEPLSNDIISAIEACRPDCCDERLPEVAAALADASPVRVAELRRSIERVDRAIMAAVQQAPLPEGLADRVLNHIRANDIQASSSATAIVELAANQRSPRRWRRSWLTAGAGLAIAASLLIAFFAWPRGTVELAEVEAQARELYKADDHRAQLFSVSNGCPTPLGGVSVNTVRGWRHVKLLDRDGFAYELSNRRVTATLYVLPLKSWFSSKLAVPNNPSAQGTMGTTLAAWTDGSDVYILVVKGSERAFWSFVPRSLA